MTFIVYKLMKVLPGASVLPNIQNHDVSVGGGCKEMLMMMLPVY